MRTILLFGIILIAECINIERVNAICEDHSIIVGALINVAILGDLITFIYKLIRD